MVEDGLVRLAKRAARKHLTPPTWSWGKAFEREEIVPHPQYCWEVECHGMVSRIPLTITGDAPRYAGWTFAAALQHLTTEGGERVNIVRCVPGHEVDDTYRTRGPFCDHCHSMRRRNDTYVLVHDDGRSVQVGSSCMVDFLGSPEAAKLAASASIITEARDIGMGGESGFSGGAVDYTLSSLLAMVAYLMRTVGWISSKVARERDECASTATIAWAYISDRVLAKKEGADPTDEDKALAKSAEEWAESLTDEAVNACSGDYLHNLRVVAMTGVASHRTAGIAGSMIVAYQNAIGAERARKERAAAYAHVGTVGKREEWAVTLDFVHGYATDYGYTTILKFVTDDGAVLVWRSTSCNIERSDVGKRYTVKGTVKEHSEYKGVKQTALTRCKVTEMAEVEIAAAS